MVEAAAATQSETVAPEPLRVLGNVVGIRPETPIEQAAAAHAEAASAQATADPAGASICLDDGSQATVAEDGALEICDASGRLRIRYHGDCTEIVSAAGDLQLTAPEGSVVVRAKDDVVVEAGRHMTHRAHKSLRQEAERIHITAEQLFEKTRDSVREISALLLTRAGRVRSLVRGGYSLMSKRTFIKSKKDTTIDGKRVLLG